MNATNVAAVKQLMSTLGVSVSDLFTQQELEAFVKQCIKDGKLETNLLKQEQPNCRNETNFKYDEWASCYYLTDKQGKVLGIVFDSDKTGKFALAVKNFGKNIEIDKAKKLAEEQPMYNDTSWIVPSDEHFKAIYRVDMTKINSLLKRLGGDVIDRTGFLSTTSQANKPQYWNVRFILPVPK